MTHAEMLWHLTVCPRRSSRAASANSPPLMMCSRPKRPIANIRCLYSATCQ